MTVASDRPLNLDLPLRRGRYDKADVDRALADMATGYEELSLERDELRAGVEALEEELAHFRELDRALRDSLVAGQRTATEVIREAKARSQQIIEEADAESEHFMHSARAESEQILRSARAERDRIQQEVKRLTEAEAELEANYRAFLLAALNVLEDKAGSTQEVEVSYARPSSVLEATGPVEKQAEEPEVQEPEASPEAEARPQADVRDGQPKAPDQSADNPNAEAERAVG